MHFFKTERVKIREIEEMFLMENSISFLSPKNYVRVLIQVTHVFQIVIIVKFISKITTSFFRKKIWQKT